jgi:nucleoside phosphorylase
LKLSRRKIEGDMEMRRAVDTVIKQVGDGPPRVLLVTAATVERDTLLRLFRQVVHSAPVYDFRKRRTYLRLGQIGGVEVITVQCEMGTVGPGASLDTVADAIDDLNPSAVIMVGIAFGIDEKKQNIGEMIVSKQVQSYEQAKVGTRRSDGSLVIQLRGDRVTASTRLLGRLRLAQVEWTGKKVRFGVMLTGEKLVDNVDFRGGLKALSDQIEGGEMEGGGLYTAAVGRKVDWIIVKAICDWADGHKSRNKDRRQASAAEQAVSFVLLALRQGGFLTMHEA